MLKSLVSMCWQGDHWSTHVEVTGMTRPGKIPQGSIPTSVNRIFGLVVKASASRAAHPGVDSRFLRG